MQYKILICSLIVLIGACHSNEKTLEKINFDLSELDKNGLRGAADGKVALSYEFCIPADNSIAEAVKAIDASLEIHRGVKGRIGCNESQFICIGSTHQSNYRAVLEQLASLDYIERIDQTFFE